MTRVVAYPSTSAARVSLFMVAALALHICGAAWPQEWATSTPGAQGLVEKKVEALWSDLQERHTTGLLIIRNDQVVFERYAEGYSRIKPHYTASMAKALVGGISLAVALSDGRIALDDQAGKYVAQWADDPVKSRITIRQLGSHTSGLADAEENRELGRRTNHHGRRHARQWRHRMVEQQRRFERTVAEGRFLGRRRRASGDVGRSQPAPHRRAQWGVLEFRNKFRRGSEGVFFPPPHESSQSLGWAERRLDSLSPQSSDKRRSSRKLRTRSGEKPALTSCK